jgi:hypothetical protein
MILIKPWCWSQQKPPAIQIDTREMSALALSASDTRRIQSRRASPNYNPVKEHMHVGLCWVATQIHIKPHAVNLQIRRVSENNRSFIHRQLPIHPDPEYAIRYASPTIH